MNEKLAAIEAQLEEIRSEAQREIEEMRQRIRTAEDNALQSAEALLHARKSGDPEMYARAAADNRTAKDIAEMYAKKIEQIKNEPCITEAEYKSYTKRIKAEMDAINKEGKAKASKLFKELEAVKEEVAPAYAKANDLLRVLQNNIYKFTYEKQMADAKEKGIPINTGRLHNEYKDNSLIVGIDNILKSHVAQNIKDGGNK